MQDRIVYASHRWGLENITPIHHQALTNNFVATAYSRVYQAQVIVKFGKKDVIASEFFALQCFAADTCVAVLDVDLQGALLLLEYLQPGTTLKDLFVQGQEHKSLKIFTHVIERLHLQTPLRYVDKFATVHERMQVLHTINSSIIPFDMVQKATCLADELMSTQGNLVVLHGDLHHENVLQRGDRWVIIDPHGLIGERAYEVGAFIRNPIFYLLQDPDPIKIMSERCTYLSQVLELDRDHVKNWAFVQAVLATWHGEEDRRFEAASYFLQVAHIHS